MRLTVKDIFFIHSAGKPSERAVVDRTAQRLAEAGFSIWGYDDWNWEHENQEVTHARSGRHIDMRRLVQRNPRPFKKIVRDEEVDTDLLESIFKGTKVVVVVSPTGERPSDGVIEELQTLRFMGVLRRSVGHRFLLCQINSAEPHPRVTFIDYAGTWQLSFSDEPDEQGIVDFAAFIVTHLLDGAMERHMDGPEWEIVGWDLPTDISRSRVLEERLQQTGFENRPSFATFQRAIEKAEEAVGRRS